MEKDLKKHQRLTQEEKDEKGKTWYKEQIDNLDSKSFTRGSNIFAGTDLSSETTNISEYRRKKINYDLFNNVINIRDFEYVCKPFGASVGELPAHFSNRDIVSGKIKVLLGMEMKRPFSWKVVATNEEATTRKEKEQFERVKQYVISQIMTPIREDIEKKYKEKQQGKPLTEEQMEEIQAQVAEELKASTPEEVKKYMERKHQDPAEVLAHQLLEYLVHHQDINRKFNKAWKHALLSGEEIYWVGELNKEPHVRVVNPLYFDYDKSPDSDFIEESEWAVAEYRMTHSEVISLFNNSLDEDDIDELYKNHLHGPTNFTSEDFNFDENNDEGKIRVIHCEWKSLKKIGFLTYEDEEDLIQEKIVDEYYTFNEEVGDIDIEWEWIPEVHEGYKIGKDIYPKEYLRPVPGQFIDLDNLFDCKLSYMGGSYDNLNSATTSIMDRMKAWQYYFNIIMYRLELLIASDKGKILAMNINSIPKSAGIDLEKFMYFTESMKVAWLNPNEEGNKGLDITNMAKSIDMSLASDIGKYVELLDYIERRCGESVGITKQMEGQIGSHDAVSNTRQSIIQSSHILEPYFEGHNNIKKNILSRLVDVGKVVYTNNPPKKKLSYILDDLSMQLLSIDFDLLENSTYGLFVSNSAKAHEAKELIQQLSHAALQNQMIDLSDVIKIIRSEGVQEAEELMKVSEQSKREEKMELEKQRGQQMERAKQLERRADNEEHKRTLEEIVVKEEERRKTEIVKGAIMGSSYNPDVDKDNDGVNDYIEVAQSATDIELKKSKQSLDERKFDHQKKIDNKKLKNEEKKLNKQK